MSNMRVENVDNSGVVLEGGEFSDELLTLTGADTIAAGTILARDSGSDKLVLFVKGGSSNGNGIPKAVLTYEKVVTGAGDVSIRALVTGKVRKEKLIIDSDGDNSNVDSVVLDQLRSYSIVGASVRELNIQDNQ